MVPTCEPMDKKAETAGVEIQIDDSGGSIEQESGVGSHILE